MHWTIAASFINADNLSSQKWLVPFIPGNRHTFEIVPRPQPLPNWHHAKRSVTDISQWLIYWEHGKRCLQATQGGVITVFPQLAAVVATQAKLTGKKTPIIAWLFNVGTCKQGIKRWLAKASLDNVDYFVVHSRREIDIYHQWLGIEREKFIFVPYQVPEIPIISSEETEHPFIAALGSAHRDFSTLFQAVERTQTPTVVISGQRALAGLSIPSNVTTLFEIARQECLKLAQQACINVIPLRTDPKITAAGQVTLVEAMRMGRAIIASNCNGVEDYIQHGETGWLVEPNSVDALAEAINTLWHDKELRQHLGQSAQSYAAQYCSDEAAGRELGLLLDRVEDECTQKRAQVANLT
ncbi:MAG: glycosyltransferase family 4 protein [Cyanobacteria bacterium]|nr:glycosyltransferase family 4 protein [Cyanobacteriota bacterium]